MPRVIRTASTLHTVPNTQADDNVLQPDMFGGQDVFGETAADVGPAQETAELAGEAQVFTPPSMAQPAPVRRRGRPPRDPNAVKPAATTAAPAAPSQPAALPTAAALQGLGMLYLFARSSGAEIDEVVGSLREALASYDLLGRS